MKRFAPLALALFAFPAFAAPERYAFDKEHTTIQFAVSHLGFSQMLGKFNEYDGSIVYDNARPEASSVEVTIKPTSVETSSKALDEHLQGDKWFNTAKFPTVTFKSTGVKLTGQNQGEITGNLTLLGVTKPVVLKTKLNKADMQPFAGKYIAGFSAEATFKRSDFGMNAYIPDVGDEIRVRIETEAVNLDRVDSAKKK